MTTTFSHNFRPLTAARAAILLAGTAVLGLGAFGAWRIVAQVEGDRGIPPLANSEDIQVSGIKVDVIGKTGAEARLAGWKQAEKQAWAKIGGPEMPIESIDSMVSSVVIESEQVGPRRYIATLGVIFDKARAGQYVGAGGVAMRSAPMLTLPVLYSGGVQQVFEVRGPWQRAWAEFQASQSPIDYVRPVGSGGESLLLTAGQASRHSRLWWRGILDQFNASDVVIPVARLERQWPGGPIQGTFTARYGPDSTVLDTFRMKADSEQQLPAMLAKAVERIDGLYRDALARGVLRPDPTLATSGVALDRAFGQIRDALMPKGGEPATMDIAPAGAAVPVPVAGDVAAEAAVDVSVQFASPDAGAVDAALGAVRSVPGVRGASTVSLAIGGISVLRVNVEGGADRLATALRAQGWKVSAAGGALRISK